MSSILFNIYMGNGVWVKIPGQWAHKHHSSDNLDAAGEKIAKLLGGSFEGWEIT